jgi:hypothetical protein
VEGAGAVQHFFEGFLQVDGHVTVALGKHGKHLLGGIAAIHDGCFKLLPCGLLCPAPQLLLAFAFLLFFFASFIPAQLFLFLLPASRSSQEAEEGFDACCDQADDQQYRHKYWFYFRDA